MKFEGARARNFVGQFFFVPNLMFFGSQEAVKKIWSKNRIFHTPEVASSSIFGAKKMISTIQLCRGGTKCVK
jgi:hypothetical protein